MATKDIPDNIDVILYVRCKRENEKTNVFRGYKGDYLAQNLSEMEEDLVICKKCCGIMSEPSFCNGETTCLVCSETPGKLNAVKAVQSSISKLEIKCPLLRDCEWKGKMSEAERHLKNCVHFLIQCNTCNEVFCRGRKELHETEWCSMRVVECQHCHQKDRAMDLDKHVVVCLEFPVNCLKNCGLKFPRKQLTQHRSECELEEVKCPYVEYGCSANLMLRKDLIAHKKEYVVEHTDMSLVEVRELRSEIMHHKFEIQEQKNTIKKLEWKCRTMKQLDGVEWELQNVDDISDHEVIKGPIFYINDYKFRLYLRYSIFDTCFTQSVNYPFFLKRLEGEFDKHLGESSAITHYKIISVNKHDYTKSVYEEGEMDYPLKIGSKSANIDYHFSYAKKRFCLTPNKSLFLRFYFEINAPTMDNFNSGQVKRCRSCPKRYTLMMESKRF